MMKQLQTVVKELNEKLGLEPAIEISGSQEYLEKMIREAVPLVVVADELTPNTWEVLRKHGWKSPNKPVLPTPSTPPVAKQEKEISFLKYFDQLLLKGGTLESFLSEMSQESKRRGKKSYQVMFEIKAHIVERRKRGYNIQEEGGVYKLEKLL